jgi:photosystem I subunit 11
MAEFVKPYNNDPFVGNLSTPVTTSTATKIYLGNLPICRKGLSPLLRGLEIGMAHGYFLIGPFYILGPLRNSENALLIGMFSALGLILILTLGLTTYGLASFQDDGKLEGLESSKGWREFTSGFFIGAFGGDIVAYILLANISFFA